MNFSTVFRPHPAHHVKQPLSLLWIYISPLLAALFLTAIVPVCAAPGVEHAQADSPMVSGADRIETLEKQMLVFVNRDREDPANAAETRGRAQPLRWNDKLAAVALAHSRDMLRRRYFAHVDPEGRTPTDRINAAGIRWRALAENIAMNQTVAGAEEDLMDEPRFQQNHRGNILNPAYTDIGIGIVEAPNGDLYITQDFIGFPPDRSDVRRGQ